MSAKIRMSIPVAFFLFLFLVLTESNLAQQETLNAAGLLPVKKLGEWGFIDRKGAVVIPPQFQKVSQFSDGVCRVVAYNKKTNSFGTGFINPRGEFVIEPVFGEASDFKEGLAVAERNEDWTRISDEDLAAWIPKLRNEGFRDAISFGQFREHAKVGYINKNAEWFIPPIFLEASTFSNGKATVTFQVSQGNRGSFQGMGIIDKQRAFFLDPGLLYVGEASEGLTALIGIDESKEFNWGDNVSFFLGYATDDGTVTIRRQLDSRLKPYQGLSDDDIATMQEYQFSNGMARIEVYGKCGYVNKKGEPAIRPRYDDCRKFADGLAAVLVEKKWGFIDTLGQYIVEPTYDHVADFEGGIARVLVRGKGWGSIDKRGAYVISPRFYQFTRFQEGIARIEDMNGLNIMDRTGKLVLSNKTFGNQRISGILGFSEGLAPIRIGPKSHTIFLGTQSEGGLIMKGENDKWGYIDRKGNLIIPAKYDEAGAFENGIAAITIEDCRGYIDKNGKLIWNPSK